MPTKEELRQIVRSNLDPLIGKVNAALRGENLANLEAVLKRLGRGGNLPHWYEKLKSDATLPNLDGKTIGSVVEMILVAVLETDTFASLGIPPLKINPARGVDLPDLDMGCKSPSENYCTSEPFFSAYERLLGSEHDALVLLTDYQEAKKKPPLRLQITKWRYLTKTQIADEGLCRLAKKQRDWLLSQNESWAKKVLRFLAFVNQSDWRAKKLVKLIDNLQDDTQIKAIIAEAEADFKTKNAEKLRKDKTLLPDSDIDALRAILKIAPLQLGVIDAADNWVVEVQKELGRVPNDNEWSRLLASPLDGLIGMSFALQWRYNFGRLFGVRVEDEAEACE
jgi:hypothetical protein